MPKHETKSQRSQVGAGYVYVLGNMYMPGIYKIGKTKRCPYLRAMELSSVSGVPHPFDVLYFAEVIHPSEAEAELHRVFQHQRVALEREFFAAPLPEIVAAAACFCVGRSGPKRVPIRQEVN